MLCSLALARTPRTDSTRVNEAYSAFSLVKLQSPSSFTAQQQVHTLRTKNAGRGTCWPFNASSQGYDNHSP